MSTATLTTHSPLRVPERLSARLSDARANRRYRRVQRELAHLSEIDPRMRDEASYAITRNR